VTSRGPGSKTVPRPRSKKSELADPHAHGPMRDVIYIFEGEGDRGGGHWRLVLECGHFVARKRYVPREDTVLVHAMFRPLSEKLAPKRVQCHHCGSGSPKQDPWIMIKALEGEVP